MIEVKTKSGVTSEGFSYELFLKYDEAQDPIEIIGWYFSLDGGGDFVIKKISDGTYEFTNVMDETAQAEHAWMLIPSVIYDNMQDHLLLKNVAL